MTLRTLMRGVIHLGEGIDRIDLDEEKADRVNKSAKGIVCLLCWPRMFGKTTDIYRGNENASEYSHLHSQLYALSPADL